MLEDRYSSLFLFTLLRDASRGPHLATILRDGALFRSSLHDTALLLAAPNCPNARWRRERYHSYYYEYLWRGQTVLRAPLNIKSHMPPLYSFLRASTAILCSMTNGFTTNVMSSFSKVLLAAREHARAKSVFRMRVRRPCAQNPLIQKSSCPLWSFRHLC